MKWRKHGRKWRPTPPSLHPGVAQRRGPLKWPQGGRQVRRQMARRTGGAPNESVDDAFSTSLPPPSTSPLNPLQHLCLSILLTLSLHSSTHRFHYLPSSIISLPLPLLSTSLQHHHLHPHPSLPPPDILHFFYSLSQFCFRYFIISPLHCLSYVVCPYPFPSFLSSVFQWRFQSPSFHLFYSLCHSFFSFLILSLFLFPSLHRVSIFTFPSHPFHSSYSLVSLRLSLTYSSVLPHQFTSSGTQSSAFPFLSPFSFVQAISVLSLFSTPHLFVLPFFSF